jgi:hypothetical protein
MARSFTAASSQYLENNSSPVGATALDTGITLAAWWYANDTNTNESVFGLEDGTNTLIYDLRVRGDLAGDEISALGYDGSQFLSMSMSPGFSATTWNHIAGTWYDDGGTPTVQSWFNGTTDGTNTNVSFSESGKSIEAVRVGSISGSGVFFDGNIAECAMWDAQLVQAEIDILAAGYSPLFVRPASLVAYWPLIGRTSPEIDIVGGYNMTLTNGPTTAAHPTVFYPSVTLNPQQPVSSVLAHYQKIKVVSTLPDTSDIIPGGAQGILVQGQIADDEVSAGNPIQTAGEAKAADGTDPGSVVESDNATIITDLNRSQLINTSHPNFWEQTENWTDSQTNNQLEVNPGAGLSLYVESVNVSAATPMEIEFVEDTAGAGTVILGPYYLPANGQLSYTFSPPIKVTENVNFGFTSTVGGDDNPHTVSATGYIGPA